MAISQNRNIDRSENGWLYLGAKSRFSTTDRWSWRITALAFPMRISNSLFCLPSLVNETPRYLNFSDCFSGTPSIWREHCFGCLDRHMVSVFVVLIFIPATEHASENLSRACWRPFWVESSNTRSSANNRHSGPVLGRFDQIGPRTLRGSALEGVPFCTVRYKIRESAKS